MFSQGLATGTVADNHTNIEQNQDNLVPGSKTTQKIHTFSETQQYPCTKKPDSELSRDEVAHHHFVVPVHPTFRKNFR